MTLPFDQPEAEKLAAVIRIIRPKWDHNAIMNQLQEAASADATYGQTCAAAIRAANNPNMLAPTSINFTENWHNKTHTNTTNAPPCEDHEGETAHNCRACKADIKLGQRPPHLIGKHHQPGDTP